MATYIREPNGELVARVEPGSSGQYYFFDWLGSTIALAPLAEGTRTDRLYYQPWGQLDTATRSSALGTTTNPYRFVGRLGYYTHYQVPSCDWLQLGVRFYNPEIRRFERRDPIRARSDLARYAYANGNPLVWADPTGRVAMDRLRTCLGEMACTFALLTGLSIPMDVAAFDMCALGCALTGPAAGPCLTACASAFLVVVLGTETFYVTVAAIDFAACMTGPLDSSGHPPTPCIDGCNAAWRIIRRWL